MNIQELETEEITRLIAELDAELQSRLQLEKEDFLDKIREKADLYGVSVEDLMVEAAEPKKRKMGKIKPKYQNPENPSETWTGRGHKPKWMKALLENGKSLEEMLIS